MKVIWIWTCGIIYQVLEFSVHNYKRQETGKTWKMIAYSL